MIVISEVGGGHRSVAEAVRCALNEKCGSTFQIEVLELIRALNAPQVRWIPELYNRATRSFLPFYNLMWRLINHPARVAQLMRFFNASMHQQIAEILRRTDLGLVLIANPFFCHLFTDARDRLGLDIPILVIVSDLATIHFAWTNPQVDLTLAPTPVARQQIIRNGIPSEKVVETGFPIHPRFLSYLKTMPEARQELGLKQEPFTILITGGGAGSGKLEYYVRLLQASFPDFQYLVVTGSNRTAYRRLRNGSQSRAVQVFGYTPNMQDLIAASNLVITKAGPSTMMECLALGRPLIITHAVGAQEQGNIEYMLRYPSVQFKKNPHDLINSIASMKESGSPPRTPPGQLQGAYQIAEILASWVRQ